MKYVKKSDGTLISSECDTIKVTESTLKKLLDAKKNANYLFYYYSGTLEDVQKLISKNDTENVNSIIYIFYSCTKLTSIPLLNTSKVTNLSNAFANCNNLIKLPLFDFSNVTNSASSFAGCRSLKEFLPTGLKVSFDLSASTKFERANLVTVLNNLGTPTTTQTLTIGSTNLAKLTEEDIAIATQKNWTLK